MKTLIFSTSFLCLLLLASCKSDKEEEVPTIAEGRDLSTIPYNPSAYDFRLPEFFPEMPVPEDNPTTEQGVELGRQLFFDPILAKNNTISCATCHEPARAFTDGLALSVGEGITPRSSMSLVNIGFQTTFFWDGRSGSLEEQSLHPIEDPNEMGGEWSEIEKRLQEHPTYPEQFRKAFGIERSTEVDRFLVAKAIAQFERSIISGNSRYDKVVYQLNGFFTDLEEEGRNEFFREPTTEHPGCAHCHNAPSFSELSDINGYRNNGLDSSLTIDGFRDFGRGAVTGNPYDNGKFRAPTLRNIELTAPYMHDGRFETLDEVLDHYASGGHYSPTRDVQMLGFPMDEYRRSALKAFLLTLTDHESLAEERLNDPN